MVQVQNFFFLLERTYLLTWRMANGFLNLYFLTFLCELKFRKFQKCLPIIIIFCSFLEHANRTSTGRVGRFVLLNKKKKKCLKLDPSARRDSFSRETSFQRNMKYRVLNFRFYSENRSYNTENNSQRTRGFRTAKKKRLASPKLNIFEKNSRGSPSQALESI